MATEWYIAKVKRYQAGFAERQLKQGALEVYNPRIVVLKSGRRKWEDLFPGYLFCKVDTSSSDQWTGLMWTPGVRYFLPPAASPVPLSEEAVGEVRQRVERWNGGGYIWVFKKGDHLRIKSGPLKGLDAIFEKYIPGRERCEVFLLWLGRGLTTTLDPADLDIATKSGDTGAWVKGYERINPGQSTISMSQSS